MEPLNIHLGVALMLIRSNVIIHTVDASVLVQILTMNFKVRGQQLIAMLNKCVTLFFFPSLLQHASQLKNVDQIRPRHAGLKTCLKHGLQPFRSRFKESYLKQTQALTLSLTFLLLGAATYFTVIVS